MALTQVSTDGIKNGTITGSDLATNVDLVDDQKLRLGTGNDLQIFHQSSGSFNQIQGASGVNTRIRQLGNGGALYLAATNIYFQNHNNNQTFLHAVNNGAVKLNYSGSTKFETTSDGAKITGKLGVGVSSPTSELEVQGSTHTNFRVLSGDNSNIGFFQAVAGQDLRIGTSTNSPVHLFVNGVNRVNLDTSGNLNIPNDSGKLQLGASQDFQFSHDGTTSLIKSVAHPIAHYSNTRHHFLNADGSANVAVLVPGNQCEFYHNGSKRLETTTEGVSISGSVSGASISDATLRFNIVNSNGDEKKAQIISTKVADISSTIEFGTTVSHSYAERMRIHSNGLVGIGTSAPVRRLHLHDDSSASNYLAVTNSTTGTSTSDGVLFGINSAEDAILWNFESTKLKFATAGTERMIIDSSGNVLIGSGSPAAKLHLNGGTYAAPTGGIGSFTQFVISNQAAGQGAGISLLGAGNMVTFINFGDSDDENVGSITYNNVVDSMQFYVNAAERMNIDSSGNLNINNDSGKIRVGTHADLEIFHNGSHSYIRDTGTGTLRIETSQMNILRADGAFSIANFVGDGAVKLYFAGGLKFETTNAGISVAGTLHTQLGFSVNSFNKESTGDQIVFQTTGTTRGSISSNGSTVAFNTSASDRSMKKNFENWTENTLALFKNINPQRFNFLDQEDGTEKEKGFIAQDIVGSFPEAYQKNDDDKYVFNPSGMVVYLMKAIQELEAEVAALKAS